MPLNRPIKQYLPAKLISLFVCFVTASCITTHYFDIQVLNPASIKIPTEISTLVVVSNTPDVDASVRKNYAKVDDSFSSTLISKLKDSPAFENRNIQSSNSRVVRHEMKSIPFKERSSYALLIPSFGVTLDDASEGFNYFRQNGTDVVYFRYKIEVVNAATKQVYDTHAITDTLLWNRFEDELTDEISPRSLALIGKIIGERYAQRFAPYWTSVERPIFYSTNKYLGAGYDLFTANNLDAAYQKWEYLYHAGTKPLASAAAHNIALIYEIRDNLDSCAVWLKRSTAISPRPEVKKYILDIEKRQQIRASLEIQLPDDRK